MKIENAPKRKHIVAGILSLALLLALCNLLVSYRGVRAHESNTVNIAATVTTDKADYQPGETVLVTGTGWQPGETVHLRYDETPFQHPPHQATAVADANGNISSSEYVIEEHDLGTAFTLTATGLSSGQTATATFTDAPPCNSGNGKVTVVGNNGSCVAGTLPQGNGPFNWEVAEGGSYTMTISGVTECAGDKITVFIQSSNTGNFCFDAMLTSTATDGSKTYTGSFTMPNPACHTYPISYKCGGGQACNNSNTFDARGPNGECTVHLRAANFDGSCNKTGNDVDCTSLPPQGCTITCPPDAMVECGGDTSPAATGTATATGCTVSFSDVETPGANCATDHIVKTITRTWTATDGAVSTSCTQTITVKDTSQPVLSGCPDPDGGTFQCLSLVPAPANVTATDNCDTSVTVDFNESQSNPGSSCNNTITRTWTASDDCGNTASCSQTITVNDTTKPVLNGCPDDASYQCLSLVPAPANVTATDNCDTSVTVDFNESQSNPGSSCNNTITRTWTATDDCGNTASCTQTITVNDTTPPVISCPPVSVQLLPGDNCPTVVNYSTGAMDNCSGAVPVFCTPPSGSAFPPGVTTVNCTATDGCGNSSSCSFDVTVYTSICGVKFYDANTNGSRDEGEAGIEGWKVKLSGASNAETFTDNDGKYCFTGLLPGEYTVTEVMPDSSWVNTTATSQTFDLTCPAVANFGNVCLGAGGGRTLGFWSNKNGQAILKANDPAWRNLLNGCNLRNADGSHFDISLTASFSSAYSAFRAWLLNATATNMSYMLSAQLAAMKLNVAYGPNGGVNGNSLVFAGASPAGCSVPVNGTGFISINALMADANAELGADGSTPSDDPERVCQEFKKNALDRANNNLNFVQSAPCPFSTPY